MIRRTSPPALSCAALCAMFLSGMAQAAGLDCTFTTLCSPLTDCQDHPGVPFSFEVTSGALSFTTESGPVIGTTLPHLSPPAIGALFATDPGSTLLLIIAGGGQAVMTQTDLIASGGLRSISYFGTCEPGT